jgi:hypothetical protein
LYVCLAALAAGLWYENVLENGRACVGAIFVHAQIPPTLCVPRRKFGREDEFHEFPSMG